MPPVEHRLPGALLDRLRRQQHMGVQSEVAGERGEHVQQHTEDEQRLPEADVVDILPPLVLLSNRLRRARLIRS